MQQGQCDEIALLKLTGAQAKCYDLLDTLEEGPLDFSDFDIVVMGSGSMEEPEEVGISVSLAYTNPVVCGGGPLKCLCDRLHK